MPATARAPKSAPTKTMNPAEGLALVGELVTADTLKTVGTELERRASTITEYSITVHDGDGYRNLAEVLKDAKSADKEIVEYWKPLKALGDKLHKLMCDRERACRGRLPEFIAKAGQALYAFDQAQARKKREEELRLAEQQRQAEEQRLLEEAAHLERQGHTALAESVVEQAITLPTSVITLPSETPDVEGIGHRANWKWRPINGDRERARQLVPREYLDLDDAKLTAFAKMHKGAAKLPGIDFYDAGTTSVKV